MIDRSYIKGPYEAREGKVIDIFTFGENHPGQHQGTYRRIVNGVLTKTEKSNHPEYTFQHDVRYRLIESEQQLILEMMK